MHGNQSIMQKNYRTEILNRINQGIVNIIISSLTFMPSFDCVTIMCNNRYVLIINYIVIFGNVLTIQAFCYSYYMYYMCISALIT